jgi:hypothetical protein
MRGESRLALLILGLGLAPALIKKSKPFSRYVGDHLIKAGEYLIHGAEEAPVEVQVVIPVEVVEIIEIVEEAPQEVAPKEVAPESTQSESTPPEITESGAPQS